MGCEQFVDWVVVFLVGFVVGGDVGDPFGEGLDLEGDFFRHVPDEVTIR